MATVNIPGRPDLDMRHKKVENVGTPTDGLDAVNKDYVDEGLNNRVVNPLVAPTNNGEILIWDNTNQRWIVEDIDIVDTGGEDNLILNVSDANEALWPTTKRWQEAAFLEKVDALPTTPTPNAGDSVYLTAQDGTNAPGPYTYQAGATNDWIATGGGSGTTITFREWTDTAHDYTVGDVVVYEGDHFFCIATHTSDNANPFTRPEFWTPMSSDGFDIDTLASLRLLNSSNALRSNVFPGDVANVINDGANNGLYLVLSSDNVNRADGTVVLSIASLGISADPRFDGDPVEAAQVDSGVNVSASTAILDAVTDHTHTIVLPTANPTTPFAVGDSISVTSTSTAYSVIQIIETHAQTEIVFEGDLTAVFAAGMDLYRANTPTQAGTVWTLPAPGADAYTQSNALNDEMIARKLLSEEVQANATAIAAFEADLVSIAAYQPQGTYLSGAGLVTPSFADRPSRQKRK